MKKALTIKQINSELNKRGVKEKKWTDHPSTIESIVNEMAKKYSILEGDKGKIFLRELKDKIKSIYI